MSSDLAAAPFGIALTWRFPAELSSVDRWLATWRIWEMSVLRFWQFATALTGPPRELRVFELVTSSWLKALAWPRAAGGAGELLPELRFKGGFPECRLANANATPTPATAMAMAAITLPTRTPRDFLPGGAAAPCGQA